MNYIDSRIKEMNLFTLVNKLKFITLIENLYLHIHHRKI